MAVANRKYVVLESGVRKVRESQNDEVIFSIVRIGGSGGKDISIVSSNFDFSAAKLVNVAAGTAAGQVLIYDQRGAVNGVASLDGSGKVPVAQLPSAVMTYEGVWNASTNSPTLADGAGDAGMVYRVGTAGSQDLGSGSISFDVGDYAIYNGTVWEKSDTTDAVASVFSRTGVVTAQNGDYTASQVTNVPAGNIAATTVQAAINELDSEKAAASHTHVAADVTDFTAAARTAAVADAINDGTTNIAPSQNAVFDALALKADVSAVGYTKTFTNDNAGSITVRQLVYVKADGDVDLVNAATASLDDFAVGMVSDASIATTASGQVYVKPGAIVAGFTGLTPGKKLYLHNSTLGSYTQDPTTIGSGNWLYAIGRALSATEVLFMPTLDPVQV